MQTKRRMMVRSRLFSLFLAIYAINNRKCAQMKSNGVQKQLHIPILTCPIRLVRITFAFAVTFACGKPTPTHIFLFRAFRVFSYFVVDIMKRITGKLLRIILRQFKLIFFDFIMGEPENLDFYEFWIFGTHRIPYLWI